MRWILSSILTCAALALPCFGQQVRKAEDKAEPEQRGAEYHAMRWMLAFRADKEVEEAVGQFLAAVNEKDIKGSMECAGLPWLDNAERVIKTEKDLEKALRQSLNGPGARRLDFEINGMAAYPQARDLIPEKGGRKLVDQVIAGKEGRVVFLMEKIKEKEKEEKIPALRYLLVRVEPGERPKVVGGPYRLTYLLAPNHLPEVAREALEKAEQLEVFALDPELRKELPRDNFSGYRILGKTVLKKAEAQKAVRQAFERALIESEGIAAACFNPRHGIRAVHNGKTVDFVICFECFRVRILDGKRQLEEVLINASAQPVFDRILRDAGALPQKKPADR